MDALFYPLTYATTQVMNLVYGMVAALDIVDFADEAGGDADQALAVPYLPGMDAIVVTEARIVLRAAPKDVDIENYSVTNHGSSGVFVSTPAPARLKKIAISYSYAPPPGSATTRVVVRGASKNGALQAGVPLFANPDFGQPGPMYGRTLGGMAVSDLGNGQTLLTLPSVLGDAWLVQLAAGGDPTELSEIALTPGVHRVAIEALPRNLSVTLAPDAEAVSLWQNPGVLLPESGDQEISFTPLAQKHLSAALKAAASSAAALPVPLRFHSDCGSAVQIVTKSLAAEYQVMPLGTAPLALPMRGDYASLALSAPASLLPSKSALRLTVKLLGRELNAASPEPSLELPSSGLRVGLEHWIAGAAAMAPRAGEPAGSVIEIASVRLYLAAMDAAEVVLEIRSDVAGAPGAGVAAPLVRQLDAGFSGWLEFELPTPLKAVSGNAPIWLALRTNKGEVRWFHAPTSASDERGSRVSADRGATWGAPNPQLSNPRALLAQLFHRVDDPLAAPVVRLQRGATVLQANLLATTQRKSAREFAVDAASLPPAVLAALAAQTGSGRVDNPFLLFSRSALDLIVESLTLSYDPFSAAGSA